MTTQIQFVRVYDQKYGQLLDIKKAPKWHLLVVLRLLAKYSIFPSWILNQPENPATLALSVDIPVTLYLYPVSQLDQASPN